MAQPLRNKNIQNDPNVNGQITQTIFNIGGASPILNSPFVVLAADPNLTNERILTAGSAITLTDNGPNSSIVVDIPDTAVTPGTYSLATVTVDQKGRITSASSGTAPSSQTTLFNDTGTNANLVFIGGKLNADASRRWSATVSGDLVWGDGTAPKVRLNYASGSQLQIVDASNNAADLSLSTLRGNAAIFSTPNTFNVSFETRTTGDVNPRFQVQGSGLIGIGGGASGMDTYLWRSGNAELSLGSSPTTADAYLRATGIKTASGDLTINPVGSNVNFSNKNLTNVATLTAGTSITTPSIASASGDLVFAPVANANFSNKNVIGVGTLTANGTLTATGLTTATGDLVLNAVGNNINFSTKNLTNATSVQTSTITTISSDLTLNPTGSNINCSNKNLFNVLSLTTPTIATSSGDLTLNPVGNINCSNKSLFGVLSLTTPTITTGSGNLSLNPSGSAVDFNGKSIINAILPSTGITYPLDYSSSTVVANMITSRIFADTQDRIRISNDANIYFGSGSATPDLFINRENSTTLRVNSVSGGFSRGNLKCDTVFANTLGTNTFNYLNIQSSGSTNGAGTNNTVISSTGASFGGGGNRCTSISSGSPSFTGNGCTSISNAAATFGSGNNNTIVGCSAASLATGSYNIIMGSGNGNTSVTSSAGGTFLWGSYISTAQSNVFGLSDSTATTVTCGTASTFYTRFTTAHYFTTNTAASIGATLGAGANSWTSISDARVKKIHCEIEGVLDKVEKLRVVKYNYLCDEEEGRCEPRIGLIAQEVNGLHEELGIKKNFCVAHPESIKNPDEPIQTVCGDEVAYLAIAAIKEMREELREARGENKELREEVAATKKENAELREGLRKTMEVVKGLSNRLKAAEGKLALVGTSVGTFDKL